MENNKFSRVVFRFAGIYGFVVLTPGFFGEKMLAQKMPPAVTHPEFFYGFFGVGLAWQVAFLIIASDPARFRPIIPAAILEKFVYVASCSAMDAGTHSRHCRCRQHGRFYTGVLFIISYLRLRNSDQQSISNQS
jgi:hypothetical protein